jgi:hypothetical protein
MAQQIRRKLWSFVFKLFLLKTYKNKIQLFRLTKLKKPFAFHEKK